MLSKVLVAMFVCMAFAIPAKAADGVPSKACWIVYESGYEKLLAGLLRGYTLYPSPKTKDAYENTRDFIAKAQEDCTNGR